MSETTTGVAAASPADDGVDTSRRDFLYLTTAATAAVGVAAVAWPFIDNLNPAADTLALSTVDVDLAPIAVGQAITVKWRGKPVFIRHRTEQEIAEAEAVEPSSLRDPQSDAERVFNAAYLVQIGICTHLGCVPLGQRPTDDKGDYNGWFCPCHGSHYDTSGRIRKGPAPLNLEIPQYMFRDETIIRLGEGEGPGAEA